MLKEYILCTVWGVKMIKIELLYLIRAIFYLTGKYFPLATWICCTKYRGCIKCSKVQEFPACFTCKKIPVVKSVNHLIALWWLNRGPVGGVLGASSSVLASTFLPPTLPLEVSLSAPFPHFFLTVYQVHHPLTPRFALENSALRSQTHSAQRHTNTEHTRTVSPRKWDKKLATPKGPASVTLLPRPDHMALGAERKRVNGRGVGTRVGGERRIAQEQKREEMWQSCRRWRDERGRETDGAREGERKRLRDTERLKKKKKKKKSS